MELRTYWRILMRRWWLVVVPLVIVGFYVLLAYEAPPPQYQVAIRFATGTTPHGVSEDYDRYYSWLASEYVAGGLADVAKTGVFAQAIANRLQSEYPELTSSAIQGGIYTDYSRSILVVYLTYGEAAVATAVADAVEAEVTTNAAVYFPQLDDVEPAARILDAAVPVQVGASLSSQLMGPAVQLSLALCAGVAVALLWHYLDPALHEAGEVEKLGLSVLAELPRK